MTPIIHVEDLSFTYPGAQRPSVDGVSFAVQRGEVFGLLGPSGAGKSTTQRLLTGQLSGYAGSARVFDVEMRDHGRSYFRRVGVGFELPNLFSKLTVRENLAFFAALSGGARRDPLELLSKVGLEDAVDTRASELSKGMKMRVNLCRALVHDPELVFLDEPTSGQDPATARRVRALIRALKDEGKTVLLTTHNMQEAAELSDRVAFLVEGRVAVIDEPRRIMLSHSDRRVRVEYDDGGRISSAELSLDRLTSDPGFLSHLAERSVLSVHSLEASLDDVFIEVTGVELS